MALGKGLGSLIPIKHSVSSTPENKAAEVPVSEADIASISVNPFQPRREFHHQELEDLINSIKGHGILQPLLVTKTDEGYQLIAGERRWKAAKIAGLKKVPIIVKEATEEEKLELALIENIQRTDLNPVEKAEGYKKLMERFQLTQEEASQKVGVSRPAFSNALRLLKLPEAIKKALIENKLTAGHAKVLLGLENEAAQLSLFKKIMLSDLSVRKLEASLLSDVSIAKKKKKIIWQDPQLLSWQDELTQKLGTKVRINKKGEGGSIAIEYYSPEELKNIISKIKD